MKIPSYKYKFRHTNTNSVIQVQIPSYKYKFRYTSTNSVIQVQIPLYRYKFRYTSTNSVIQVQIPSYKYKFRHTSTNSNKCSRKLVKSSFRSLSYVSPEYLLCCCSYSYDESEKQTHLCQTTELSDYWTAGPVGCMNVGLSD
jgi:hypothetical protein